MISLTRTPDELTVVCPESSVAAVLSVAQGRLEEGVSMARPAAQLDPLNLVACFTYGLYAYYAGNLEEATAAMRRTLELNAKAPRVRLTLGLILLARERPQEALAEIEQETDTAWRLQGLALAHHALGHKTESDSALTQLVSIYHFSAAFQIAEIFSYRGEIDQAFEWLERAYAQHDTGLNKL